MSVAPRDGTIILVCELPGGSEEGQVMPAAYMRANGDPRMEGFWGCWTTSICSANLMQQKLNSDDSERFAVGWREIALTPLCWKPLPAPEEFKTLRRRQSQILRHKHRSTEPAETAEA